jgi:hypothetical protein
MLMKVKDLLLANKEHLNGLIINGPSFGQMDMHVLSQLKGQILAYESVLETKEFLLELTEDEVNHAESTGSKNLS